MSRKNNLLSSPSRYRSNRYWEVSKNVTARRFFISEQCKTAEFVLEITSRHTRRRDSRQMRGGYAALRIPECSASTSRERSTATVWTRLGKAQPGF